MLEVLMGALKTAMDEGFILESDVTYEVRIPFKFTTDLDGKIKHVDLIATDIVRMSDDDSKI